MLAEWVDEWGRAIFGDTNVQVNVVERARLGGAPARPCTLLRNCGVLYPYADPTVPTTQITPKVLLRSSIRATDRICTPSRCPAWSAGSSQGDFMMYVDSE